MNKHTATDFLHLVCAGRVREAYDRHVTKGFRHHNAWFPSDGKSLALACGPKDKESQEAVGYVMKMPEAIK